MSSDPPPPAGPPPPRTPPAATGANSTPNAEVNPPLSASDPPHASDQPHPPLSASDPPHSPLSDSLPASLVTSEESVFHADSAFADPKKIGHYYPELTAEVAAKYEAREFPSMAISVCLVELVTTAPRILEAHPFYRGPRVVWALFLLALLTSVQFILLVLLEVGPSAQSRMKMEALIGGSSPFVQALFVIARWRKMGRPVVVR